VAINAPAVAGEAAKIPAAPVVPKAPGVVPAAPAAPAVAIKPPAVAGEAAKIPAAPVLPKAPGVVPAAPAAPASSVSPNKQTAKISLPTATKSVPQATINLKKPLQATVAPSENKSAPAEAAATNVAEGQAGNSDLILGIAATIVALLSLGIQVWTMLS
jgi:hypothetical protein